jgi:hypothetical protein
MVVLDDNFVLGCGPGADYPKIQIFQCMLERIDAITNEVQGLITFVLAYPTVQASKNFQPIVVQYNTDTVHQMAEPPKTQV